MVITPQTPITQAARPYDYQTIADLKSDDSLRALIFSPPKHGKTALLLTFPDSAIADYDGDGVKTAKSPWFRTTYPDRLKPDQFRFKQFKDEVDDYGMVKGDPRAFWDGISWINQVLRDPTRKTIGLDSMSSMSRAAAFAGIQVAGKRGRSKTWANKDIDHMMLMTQADFGAEMSAIEQLLDQLMKVRGKHIIVTAHEREELSDGGAVIGRSPLLTGAKLRAGIARWFDEVWYLDTDMSGKRILRCQPYGVLKGVGSRLGLPAVIENPSYDKIMKLLNAGG